MKRKITITTGSRSEYGILRPVLKAISHSKKLELCLIVAGMHLSKKHGLTINEIKKDGFKISAKVDMIPREDTTYSMGKALGYGVIKFIEVFHRIRPDINIILGDRDEAFASALAASHMNIPNAHIHGGDKSQAGIDEYNRHAITKLSNIHFAATKKSKIRIIRMGENPKFVYLTGSPSIDEIINQKITKKNELEKKYNIKFSGKEILLLQHPVTTQTTLTKKQILHTLEAIKEIGNTTIAIAPNSDAGNKIIFEKLRTYSKRYSFINMYRNLPRCDYLGMIQNCGVLVGNSSSGIIEASYFDIPVVNIGIRQKDRETGKNVTNVESGSMKSIHLAISNALKYKRRRKNMNKNIYGAGNASKKIVRHLEKIKLNDELIMKQIFY